MEIPSAAGPQGTTKKLARADTPRAPRIFHGWYVVAACAVVAFYSWGLGFYGLGVYLATFQSVHGWSTTFISLATMVYYLFGAAVVLFIGSTIDRHGTRGVLIYGAVAMGVSVAALGFITARWQLIVVYLIMSTGYVSLGATAISATLLPWFNRLQGRAMSLALTGPSVGGIVLVPLLVGLTARYGFRVATIVAGLLVAVSVILLVLFVIKRRPQDLGLLPDGAAAAGPDEQTGAVGRDSITQPAERRWRRSTALRSMAFWTLALPFCLALIAQVGFLVHQLPFLEPGLGRSQAAFVVSLTTLAALLGRVVMGFVVDRVDRRVFSAACFAVQGMALLLLAAVATPLALIVGSIGFGLGVGIVITLPPLLVREEFGVASFGAVFAMVYAGMQVAVAAGPAVVGVLRDQSNGYQGALCLLVALEAVAIVVVLAGRRYHRPSPLPASP